MLLRNSTAGILTQAAVTLSAPSKKCPSYNLPSGSWDSHLHIMDPVRYPFLPGAEYTTGVHGPWDNPIFEHRIGCQHVVLIQPSVYGDDNTLLLETLEAYGPDRARAVVVFEPASVTQDTLKKWHDLGVRGVRVNLLSHNTSVPTAELEANLQKYAKAIKPFGWALQLYVSMHVIPALESFIPNLEVPVIFDHIGSPEIQSDPSKIDGFDAFLRLLKSGHVWTKISGPYRLSKQKGPTYTDVDPIIKELLREVPERLVYGSDWPHTRFEGLDIKPWVEHLVGLTGGNETLRDMLFATNPKKLWGA